MKKIFIFILLLNTFYFAPVSKGSTLTSNCFAAYDLPINIGEIENKESLSLNNEEIWDEELAHLNPKKKDLFALQHKKLAPPFSTGVCLSCIQPP